jgi:hypothetical protein
LFEPPGREQLDEIAVRPLFSPTRRPFVAAEPEVALTPAPASLPPLELIGVLLTQQRGAALLRSLDGGDPGWVREEDAMAGWRLQKSNATACTLPQATGSRSWSYAPTPRYPSRTVRSEVRSNRRRCQRKKPRRRKGITLPAKWSRPTRRTRRPKQEPRKVDVNNTTERVSHDANELVESGENSDN